jgi:hypothetical protein
MNLTVSDEWTDREWRLAEDVVRVLRQGGPLSLREQALPLVCGSEERALELLAAVRRAHRQLDALMTPKIDWSPSPAPRPSTCASSVRRGAPRRTAARGALRMNLPAFAAITVTAFVPVWLLARTIGTGL